MKIQPRVSILVPCYNVEKFLQQCLDSLVNQTLKEIEIICINDGSTDGTLDILKSYQAKDARVRIIDKPNSGYGHSMNLGLEEAHGEYIGIVESDDYAELNMFEELFGLAIRWDVDVVKSDFWRYRSKDNYHSLAKSLKSHVFGRPLTISEDLDIIRVQPSIWAGIYRREFLNKKNIRFLETPGASYQDVSFAFKAWTLSESFVLTPKAYLNYRIDNENSSVKSKGKVYAVCDEFSEIDRVIETEKLGQIERLIDVKLAIQLNTYNWNVLRIDESFKSEFMAYFSKIFRDYNDAGLIHEAFFTGIKRDMFMQLIQSPDVYLAQLQHLELLQSEERSKKAARRFVCHLTRNKKYLKLFGIELINSEIR